MRTFFSASLAAVLLAASLPHSLLAQTAEDLLNQARAQQSLRNAETPSFRLQADISLSDEYGKPAGTGTLTFLHVQGGPWKEVVQVGDQGWAYSGTTPGHTETLWRKQDGSMPWAVSAALTRFTEPVPAPSNFQHGTLTLKQHKISGIAMDCVEHETPEEAQMKSQATAADTAFCFEGGEPHLLRFQQSHLGELGVYDSYLKLGNEYVAHEFALRAGAVVRARIQVSSFTSAPSLTAAEVAIPPEGEGWKKQEVRQVTHVGRDVLSGALVHRVQPQYPEDAKHRGVQGLVVLHAIIGSDGAIKDLSVISTPDFSLSKAALDAVKHWVYRPYLLNGVPVDVDTDIAVSFAMGH